nr:putative ribonuclease H-like domain-containing protein [Tanacetum cinerariifolium]
KQTIVATSTTEAEYVAAASCYGQVLWIQNQLLDYGPRLIPLAIYPRARIAQSYALPPVVDEPASPVRDVSQMEACPTDSGFIADQDRATIAKSSTLLHDSAPRVTSHAAKEGSMQQLINELTALCTSLQRQHSELLAKFQGQEVEINKLKERVKILEDKRGVIGDRSEDDAPIKGRRIDEEEVATKRVSDDTEEVRLDEREVAAERASEDTKEIAIVLTTMDATTVSASGTTKVLTGSGSIPTAGPSADEVPTGSDVVPTTSLVFATATVVTTYRRRKGKEVMVKSETSKKQKLQEQIDA